MKYLLFSTILAILDGGVIEMNNKMTAIDPADNHVEEWSLKEKSEGGKGETWKVGEEYDLGRRTLVEEEQWKKMYPNVKYTENYGKKYDDARAAFKKAQGKAYKALNDFGNAYDYLHWEHMLTFGDLSAWAHCCDEEHKKITEDATALFAMMPYVNPNLEEEKKVKGNERGPFYNTKKNHFCVFLPQKTRAQKKRPHPLFFNTHPGSLPQP